jgi:putative membrane protein
VSDVGPVAADPGLAPRLGTGLRSGAILLLLSCGLLAAVALALHDGAAEVRQAVAVLPAGLAASVAVHTPQIVLTALAWWCVVPPAVRPPVGSFVLLRWFRESAMTLLPAGAVVGQVAAAGLLSRRGVPGPLAAATATMDVTVESTSQAVFTLAGLGVLFLVNAHVQSPGAAVLGSLLGVAGIAALIALQGGRTLRWAEAVVLRRFPNLRMEVFRTFRLALAELRHARGALARAFACHSAAWVLGSAEIVAVLALVGRPVGWGDALVIESLSQAMRIAGVVLPGAIGVQEGAIIAAAALVGVPPQSALLVALVRRGRELVVSVVGLAAWAETERRERRISKPLPSGL